MTPPDRPEREQFILVLIALPDPHAAHGSPARTGSYRLKLALKDLLRGFGLKCVHVSPSRDGRDAGDTTRGDPPPQDEQKQPA